MGRYQRLTRPPAQTRRAQWFLGVAGRVLPAVSCGPRRLGGAAVAIGGEEGGAGSPGAATLGRSCGCEQPAWKARCVQQLSGLQQRSSWALGRRVCAAAIGLGYGSGASESVHRGLGELVSSSGWAAWAPPPGSPGSGRARAVRRLLRCGHQGIAGRQRGGPAITGPAWALHAQRTREAPAREVLGPEGPGSSALHARGHLSAHW